MRGVNLDKADLTGVKAQNINFFTAGSKHVATATDVIAPGADFTGAYLVGADFSGTNSILQSTNWTNTMLMTANFDEADLRINTSGGVNSGTNTTFQGAYMYGSSFNSTKLDDVSFYNTYWDALGVGGGLNLLMPKSNLSFRGYWKDLELPECPFTVEWDASLTPPLNVTNDNNTCPNGDNMNCDSVWGDPDQDISEAYYKSATPDDFPQDPNASPDNQCGNSTKDPNPKDYCWTSTSKSTTCPNNL